MNLSQDIRFRVNPKLRARVERVLKVRAAGKVNPDSISDFGREAVTVFLEAKEKELGIRPSNGNGKAVTE